MKTSAHAFAQHSPEKPAPWRLRVALLTPFAAIMSLGDWWREDMTLWHRLWTLPLLAWMQLVMLLAWGPMLGAAVWDNRKAMLWVADVVDERLIRPAARAVDFIAP